MLNTVSDVCKQGLFAKNNAKIYYILDVSLDDYIDRAFSMLNHDTSSAKFRRDTAEPSCPKLHTSHRVIEREPATSGREEEERGFAISSHM